MPLYTLCIMATFPAFWKFAQGKGILQVLKNTNYSSTVATRRGAWVKCRYLRNYRAAPARALSACCWHEGNCGVAFAGWAPFLGVVRQGSGPSALNISLGWDHHSWQFDEKIFFGYSLFLLASILHKREGASLPSFEGTPVSTLHVSSHLILNSLKILFPFLQRRELQLTQSVICQSCSLTQAFSTTVGCLPFLSV